jgi:tetratricopeptide (TPR) repeat protein
MNAFHELGFDQSLGALGEFVLLRWFEGAEFELSPLHGGRSGAAVLRVDVRGPEAGEGAGVYVLKLVRADSEGINDTGGDERAIEASPGFASQHVPAVAHRWSGEYAEGQVGHALLYEIAGGSLLHYASAARKGSNSLLALAPRITASTLDAWARPANVTNRKPIALLEHIAGSAGAEDALNLASDFYGTAGLRHEHGHVFLSPCTLFSQRTNEVPLVESFEHGDFHSGNLLVPVDIADGEEDFWVIDFERASDGFLGLDLAYLELSIILDFYDDITPSSLARCLDHVEHPARRNPLPDGLHWLAEFMRTTRAAVDNYAGGLHGRRDDVERQLVLARIAEALRWANRFKGGRKSNLALMYAGWFSMHYERLYGDAIGSDDNDASEERPGPERASQAEQGIWSAFWKDTAHLSRVGWTYVLVAERLPSDAELAALGHVPWSAVIDLDPNSDHDGLYSHAGPVLAGGRAVHVFSDELPTADPRRGTFWLMSAGWRLRREQHVEFMQWFRTRLRTVRTLFDSLHRAVGEGHVAVVALLGERAESDQSQGQDRLVRVLEAFDEVWQGRGSIHVVGEAEPGSLVPTTFYPLPPSVFLGQMASTFGTDDGGLEYRLPSADGSHVVVQQDTLQVLQEHFDVLHDRSALTTIEEEDRNDAFWRGGQILWADLAAEVDVPRSVNGELKSALATSLERHRTRTVVVEHRPGAGGTTAALRAAWDLHWSYPVAILRPGRPMTADRVSLIADRLQQLAAICSTSVLFVAEAADLPDVYRESLHRELSARYTRVTTLCVRRVLSTSEQHLSVSDPLDAAESKLFLAKYRGLVSDPARLAELGALTSDAYERYCSPFFFGLIAFQRDFEKIEDYVHNHLRDTAGRARDVLCHLSLVSLYSNSGIQFGLLQRLFRLSSPSQDLTIEDLLGPAAALVVQRGGRYRFAHQLLAEEALARLVGPDWRLHLNDLALDLIEDICTAGDPSSEDVGLLFRQMFIDRVSGGVDGTEDRGDFAPIIAELDSIDPSIGHQVLKFLAESMPDEPHFWNHLGRHQVYRLKRDLDLAERYLETATRLSPNDAIHHHALGLARRARMRQGLRSAQGQGAEAVKAVIDAWFIRTVECFEHARALSADDIYGYITHVQSIIEAARALRAASKAATIADIASTPGEWVVEQITVANTLLEDASQLYGSLDRQDDYLQQCVADIYRLYGDLNSVVRQWEIGHAAGKSTPFSRRALAQAYYVRAGRSWRSLTEMELRRVASLSEANLLTLSPRDEDYLLWFESTRLLPEFDADQALTRLELWSARLPSWRPAFYQYVLRFLLWLEERTDDVRAMDKALDDCGRLAPGRDKHSYSWLCRDPHWCPLIADSDLGEWDRRLRFWSDTELLQRVNGVIDVIHGPSAGSITMGDRRVHAFFVPAQGGFLADADENKPVNFYLGFSPSGLRAWGVERGHTADGRERKADVATEPSFVGRPRQSSFHELQVQRARDLPFSEVRELCRSFVEVASARGTEITVNWLEERVCSALGLESLASIRENAIRLALKSLPNVTVEGDDGENGRVLIASDKAKEPRSVEQEMAYGHIAHFDRLDRWGTIAASTGANVRFDFDDVVNPSAVPDLRRHTVVEFIRSTERHADRAIRVEILGDRISLYSGRLVDEERLPELVAGELRRYLEDALAGDRPELPVAEVDDYLERTFRGGVSLGPRLGLNGLRSFYRQQSWVIVSGAPGAQTLRLKPGSAFGSRHAPAVEALVEVPVDAASFSSMLTTVVGELRQAGRDAMLSTVGDRLRAQLGEAAYRRMLGKGSLSRMIADTGEWTTITIRPGVVVVQEPGSVPSAETDRRSAGPSTDLGSRELARVVVELESEGMETTLQRIGARMKAAMGEDIYAEFAGKSLKLAIERISGWSTAEVRPGVVVVSRDAPSTGKPDRDERSAAT